MFCLEWQEWLGKKDIVLIEADQNSPDDRSLQFVCQGGVPCGDSGFWVEASKCSFFWCFDAK